MSIKLSEIFPPCSQGYEHSPMMHVQDQKPSGTAGAPRTTGDNQRELNTIVTNSIVGSSLGTNSINLPAGTYYIRAYSNSYGGSVTFSNRLSLYVNVCEWSSDRY